MARLSVFLASLFILAAFVTNGSAYNEDDIMVLGPAFKLIRSTVGTIISIKDEDSNRKETGAVEIKGDLGGTKIFPIDATVKVVDDAMRVLTLRDLRKGQRVMIDQIENAESEKVETIKVIKQER